MPRPQRPATLPFAHLNLRWNPFRELTPEEWAEVAVVELAGIARRLARPGFAVQFTGACGRGKTTHLHALRAHVPDAPYVYFAEGERPPRVPRAPVLFLDELQRMPPRKRRRLFRRPASFVIGSHTDHTRELRRAGVEVEAVELSGLTPDRLRHIVTRRIEWARRGPGPVPYINDAGVRHLIRRFGDDLRAIEHHLYEVFQTLREAGHVRV